MSFLKGKVGRGGVGEGVKERDRRSVILVLMTLSGRKKATEEHMNVARQSYPASTIWTELPSAVAILHWKSN